MENLLALIYPEDEIFVHEPRFKPSEPMVTVTCVVQISGGYTVRPIPYVTAENYVRILSQTSYLLVHHIIERRLVRLDITPQQFVSAMVNYQLFYRNLAMTFHKRVPKGESFKMDLVLKDVREIHRLQDFILFHFANLRTVISGEMSFIYAE